MSSAIASFMTNKIVLEWIKPILIPLVIASISYIIGVVYKRKKSINVIETINVANKRLIDSIRPFFIQRIKLNKDVLISIRNAISREYKIEDESLFSIGEIKENVILDVSETRFLKDQDKMELIDFIESTFDEYEPQEKDILEKDKVMLIDAHNKIERYNNILIYLGILGVVAFFVFIFMDLYTYRPIKNYINKFIFSENITSILISIMWIIAILKTIKFSFESHKNNEK
ncbi:hypothetical protein KYB31_15095 [Clostridium felsineum]|uniref:hypothetical protein n=1 Tax=Clostridium felsineum TaxID=36839 RepID=UPI00214D1E09|nr:hypothetical protein [Clostridium felsineum]MCR3760304.1 hypothetical protein [Clostridium felsineum]